VPSSSALRGENINHEGMEDTKNLTKNEKPKTKNDKRYFAALDFPVRTAYIDKNT